MNLARGGGYDHATIMVISDYVRRNDTTENECLSGFYLRKLSSLFSGTAYPINEVYRTCVIKSYERGLGSSTFRQDQKILAAHYEENLISAEFYTDMLWEEILAIKPKVIIAMGELPLQLLTGKQGITKWRGSTLEILPNLLGTKLPGMELTKVVPCQHIAIEQIDEKEKYILALDIGKAVKLSHRSPHYPVDDYHITIARTTGDYLNYRKKFPDNPEWMTTDVETHLGFITCASHTFDGRSAVVVPLTGSTVSIDEQARMSQLIARDLANPLIKKNNQNIGYDKRMYQRFGFLMEPVCWDTMLAAHTLAPEFLKNLGFLISVNTLLNYHKDEGKEFDPAKHSFNQLYEYCAKDSIGTHRVMETQRKDLEDAGHLEFFENFVMRLFPLYYHLDSVGILQDKQKRDELRAKYGALLSLKELELHAIAGQPINLNSPDQIGKWMEEKHLPVYRHRTEKGFMKPNTDIQSIKKMLGLDPKDYSKARIGYTDAARFLNLVLLCRRIDKILEYVEVGVHPDGRIRTSSKIGATTSGRTSGSKTSDQDWIPVEGRTGLKSIRLGCSFQTVTKHGFIIEGDNDEDIEEGIIGKDVREMYQADPGWCLVEIDRSQAEARVVDLLAEDYDSLAEYGKVDKHCKVAALIFPQYSYGEILRLSKREKTDEGEYMRSLGKKGKHSVNYDTGDFVFSSMANIPRSFAKTILATIHRGYPNIRGVFHKQVETEIRDKRFLINPYDRPRYFYSKLDSHGIKVGLSWYPQSVISDGTKQAALKIKDSVDSMQAKLVAENHDSLTALVKRGYIRTYVKIARAALEEPIDFRRGTFYRDYLLHIPTDVSIGRKNWGHMKEMRKVKNA